MTDPDVAAQIAAGYRAGRSMRALAAEYGISRGRVQRLLHEAEVPTHPNAPAVAEALRRYGPDIARRYEHDGASQRDLACAYGLSTMTIRRALQARGTPLRSISEATRLSNLRRHREPPASGGASD